MYGNCLAFLSILSACFARLFYGSAVVLNVKRPPDSAPGEGWQDIDDIFRAQAQPKVPDSNLVTKETAPGDDPRKRRSSCRSLRTIDRKYGGQEFGQCHAVGEVVVFVLNAGGATRGGKISHQHFLTQPPIVLMLRSGFTNSAESKPA